MSVNDVSNPSPVQAPRRGPITRSRQEAAHQVTDFEQARSRGCSQRQFAREQGVARTTLQGWLGAKEKLDAAPELVSFFESPTGLALLHRLVVGVHLFFEEMGGCGLRLVSEFFRRVGLSPFVASSYGSQQKQALQMEQQIICYEEQERARLSSQMAPKEITLVEDENFHHQQPCLVAIEPVSNYLLVERRSEHRDGASWNQAVAQGTLGMPVQIIQVTSDEAKGLDNHVREGLGVHRSSDVFHVQHEASKGTSAALCAKVREAEGAYDKASQQVEQVQQAQDQYQAAPSPGRPPDFAARHEAALGELEQAQQHLVAAQAHKAAMQECIRGLSAVYHPFDLSTGVALSADELRVALSSLFHKMRQVATKAALGQSAKERIEKAARVVPNLVATLAFFHLLIRTRVQQGIVTLALPEAVGRVMLKILIPALYLRAVAKRSRPAARRHHLEQQAQHLLSTLGAAACWQALSPAVQQQLWGLAQHCAHLFQRSSSCVEGRNGHLSLRQHHLHLLSDRKLRVLTILHNYMARRPDGTTAAQRFFGAVPVDLFESLCDQLKLPARSRKPRRQAPPPVQSTVAA